MRKIFHPAHKTASSRRTSGMPMFAVTADGQMTDLNGTFKQARMIEVPDSTAFIMRGYSSNSGRRTVYFEEAVDGMPPITNIHENDGPSTIDAMTNIKGDARKWVYEFLWGA